MYLLHHEEIESLAKNIPGVKRIRFFMTFGQSYLTHMKCLENVGMLSTSPIEFEGKEIVPIQFLKALLPDPATLDRVQLEKPILAVFSPVKKMEKRKQFIFIMYVIIRNVIKKSALRQFLIQQVFRL